MSKFTSGKWIVKELLTTWGVFAMNEGKREPVANCLKEADARLIAAAPKMYELLNSICNYINELENIMPHFPDALSLFAKNGIELLARIDETEASNG